jgi:hypothetical protein
MRALRNPYVMTVLVAVAIALVYYRFRSPRVAAAPPPAAKQERVLIAGPDASMDLDHLGWSPSPTRDAFRAPEPVEAPTRVHEADPVADPLAGVLDLKAVWLQEKGSCAVINGKVLSEGDSILNYRVEKILADGVLVQGPGGNRKVNFKPPAPRPPAVIASAASLLSKVTSKSPPGKPAQVKSTPGKSPTQQGGHGLQDLVKESIAATANGNPQSPVKVVLDAINGSHMNQPAH